MKKTAFFAIFLFLSFPSMLLAKYANLYAQLQNVNAQWALQTDVPAYLHKLMPLENDREAIRTHLYLVENILRNRDVSALPPIQKQNRLKNLEVLHKYWQQGSFPINTQLPYRNPIFIDPYDNFCAVGFLIKESGNEEISREIQKTQNFAYLKDIHAEKLTKWVAECGLSVGELAWIQPGYMPMDYVMPMKDGLSGKVRDFYVHPTGELTAVGDFSSDFSTWYSGIVGFDWMPQLTQNTNGTIFAVSFWDNKWFLGGDFTQVNGQNLERIVQIDQNGQLTAMGTLAGTVRDLRIFNGELYAAGDFGIMKWDGTSWQSLGLCNGEVRCLYEWKNKLIAGGNFTVIGGANATNIASYNGFYFSNMENGVPKPVNAIADFKGNLFVGTDFSPATQTNMGFEDIWYYNDVIWRPSEFMVKGKAIYAMQEKFGHLYIGGEFEYMPMVGYFGKNMMKLTYYDDTTYAVDGFATHHLANDLYVGGEFLNSFGPISQPLNSVGYFVLTPLSTEPEQSFAYKVYPNPTQNDENVHIAHKKGDKIHVLDITGRDIPIEVSNLNPELSMLHTENLPKGIYFVRIGEYMTTKLQVK